MAKRPEVRSYDYVNKPYAQVRAALTEDALEVFRSATRAAADRARSLASELRVDLGGVEVGAQVDITIASVDEVAAAPGVTPTTRIRLGWKASRRPALFPVMDAVLSIYPLTSTETQLDFSGSYEPPLAALGAALDAVVGHRIAEASVQRFVADVASTCGARDHPPGGMTWRGATAPYQILTRSSGGRHISSPCFTSNAS